VSRLERWRARIGYAWAIGRRTRRWRLPLMMLRGLLEPLVSWRTFDFYVRDLAASPLPPFQAAIPLRIRMATDEDFVRFRSTLLREGVPWEEIEARRRAGDRCFIGVVEDAGGDRAAGERLIHFTWLFQRSVSLREVGATLRLGPDEAYGAFAYTEPAWRGRAVYPAVSNFMLRWEQATGVRWHYLFIMRHNLPARRITVAPHVPAPAVLARTVRALRVAFVPGFLAHGLKDPGRPRLEPLPARDLGRLGLWIRRKTLRVARVRSNSLGPSS
jgi:hypothetical protein